MLHHLRVQEVREQLVREGLPMGWVSAICDGIDLCNRLGFESGVRLKEWGMMKNMVGFGLLDRTELLQSAAILLIVKLCNCL